MVETKTAPAGWWAARLLAAGRRRKRITMRAKRRRAKGLSSKRKQREHYSGLLYIMYSRRGAGGCRCRNGRRGIEEE